jgi:hypothetical protein
MNNSAILLLGVILFSCASEMKNEVAAESAVVQPVATLTSDVAVPNLKPDAKLIRTADFRFRVSNLQLSTTSIEGMVAKYPAHISNSNMTASGNSLETRMTIRVQSEYFNDLLKEISKEAVLVHYRNIKTDDVTKQFVDLESRLRTKNEILERYKEILRKKAGTIEELLSAERQIGELQEEIEATVSKLNYLKDQVSYSTINLEYYEESDGQMASSDDSTLRKFGDAFLSGFNGMLGVLVGLTHLWPLLLFIGSLAYYMYRRKRRMLAVQSSVPAQQ